VARLNKAQIKLAKQLTYSGTLPLLFCVLGYYANCKGIDFRGAAIAYALLIIAFLSGIHWAIYLSSANKCPINLFLRSNITTLLAYATYFIATPDINLSLELICFLALLYWDKKLERAGVLPLWFFQLRCYATFIVGILLISLALPSLESRFPL